MVTFERSVGFIWIYRTEDDVLVFLRTGLAIKTVLGVNLMGMLAVHVDDIITLSFAGRWFLNLCNV